MKNKEQVYDIMKGIAATNLIKQNESLSIKTRVNANIYATKLMCFLRTVTSKQPKEL